MHGKNHETDRNVNISLRKRHFLWEFVLTTESKRRNAVILTLLLCPRLWIVTLALLEYGWVVPLAPGSCGIRCRARLSCRCKCARKKPSSYGPRNNRATCSPSARGWGLGLWHASDSLCGWGWVNSGGHRRPNDKPALPRGRAFSTLVDGQKKGRLSTTLWQKLVLLGSTVALKSQFPLPCEKSLCHFWIRKDNGKANATAMNESSCALVGFTLLR